MNILLKSVFLENSGYIVTWKLTNSVEYGIPQKRERVFIVGIREDLNKKYEGTEILDTEL